MLTISNAWYAYKTKKQLKIYFFSVVGVVIVVLVVDFFDGDECVRCVRFFVSVVVSPVKYEVTFCNKDESDHEDFFVSVWRGDPRLTTLLGELSALANLNFRDLSKFLRAIWLWRFVNFKLRTYFGSTLN